MKTENGYVVTYKGVDYEITEQEWKELVDGWRTMKDMFD